MFIYLKAFLILVVLALPCNLNGQSAKTTAMSEKAKASINAMYKELTEKFKKNIETLNSDKPNSLPEIATFYYSTKDMGEPFELVYSQLSNEHKQIYREFEIEAEEMKASLSSFYRSLGTAEKNLFLTELPFSSINREEAFKIFQPFQSKAELKLATCPQSEYDSLKNASRVRISCQIFD